MSWYHFPFFAGISSLFLIIGSVLSYFKKNYCKKFLILGILSLTCFIVYYWINIARLPFKTIGETRLWYAFFMSIIGYILYEKYTYKWILLYSNLFAILFLILNVVFPEVHDKTLAPALQSVWFPPHVVIYIISYSLLGASFIIAIKGYYYVNKKNYDKAKEVILVADNIVESGFCLLTLGLIFGAFWAKQAWGHYWTWDPKETWALLTWLIYLIYIHLRYNKKENIILPIILLIAAFLILLTAWFGINYLPSSQGSIHTYNS